jgi:hypothetical protein
MIEIISVPIIVTAVYWIMNLYKVHNQEKGEIYKAYTSDSSYIRRNIGINKLFYIA